MRAFLVELLKDDALQLLDRGGMSKAAMAGGHDQLGLSAVEVGAHFLMLEAGGCQRSQ